MNLLFYTTEKEETGERLQKVIDTIVPKGKGETHRTIKSLTQRLRKPRYDSIIAVLMASTREDLYDLLSIRDLLRGISIILILPDRNADTISKGHILRPRFLTYKDSNFGEITAVLGKML
ncbi:MAG: hypothetical protein SWO11_09815 [Thermodesulfobacteriota bacterium]|nr:hypothetical protein [Thermodesulfobacteriota bacterium]